MIKNKKGLTLVELLSVIVLIGLLLGIGIPGVMRIRKNMQEKSLNTKITQIEQAAILWGQDNKTLLQANEDCKDKDGNSVNCYKISIEGLIEDDYLDSEDYNEIVYNDPYGESMLDKCVNIYKKNNRVYAYYSKEDSSCENGNTNPPDDDLENPSVSKTLVDTIMDDERIIKNDGSPTFTGVETEEKGMYKAPDDYGDSWYFRGAQSYNYVNFAGFTWRIVRINGNESVRIILDGSLDKVKKEGETTPVYKNIDFSYFVDDGLVYFGLSFTNRYDNTYVGYMYGTAGSSDYNSTHQNINDNRIKDYVDAFYKKYLLDYESYFADVIFCGDKSIASNVANAEHTALGYGKNKTYYSAHERLNQYYNVEQKGKPTLECAKGATDNYSRYTVNSTSTTKGVNVNNDLTYPIALLSADEALMAGAYVLKGNESYYLYDSFAEGLSYSSFWTMTPNSMDSSASVYILSSGGSSFGTTSVASNGHAVRPVINLSANVLVDEGEGTKTNPYTVKLN